MSFIAGKYAVTLDGATVGQISDGVRPEHQVFKELIKGDNFAETPQDGIFRGMDAFISYRLMEYNGTSARKAFWPYGSLFGTMDTVIGTLDVNSGGTGNAKQLVLTALAGTPAAATPATITAPRCILAEGFPVEILLAPSLRLVPIRQRAYIDSSGVFWTFT